MPAGAASDCSARIGNSAQLRGHLFLGTVDLPAAFLLSIANIAMKPRQLLDWRAEQGSERETNCDDLHHPKDWSVRRSSCQNLFAMPGGRVHLGNSSPPPRSAGSWPSNLPTPSQQLWMGC